MLPIIGFDSEDYDTNLLKIYPVPIAVIERDIEPIVIYRLVNLPGLGWATFSCSTILALSIEPQPLVYSLKLTRKKKQ